MSLCLIKVTNICTYALALRFYRLGLIFGCLFHYKLIFAYSVCRGPKFFFCIEYPVVKHNFFNKEPHNDPPTPTTPALLGCRRAPVWVPGVCSRFPLAGCLTHSRVHESMLLSPFVPASFPTTPCPYVFPGKITVSDWIVASTLAKPRPSKWKFIFGSQFFLSDLCVYLYASTILSWLL